MQASTMKVRPASHQAHLATLLRELSQLLPQFRRIELHGRHCRQQHFAT